MRSAVAQLLFTRRGASHDRMGADPGAGEPVAPWLAGQAGAPDRCPPPGRADRPYAYDEARALPDAHRGREDVIIVSTPGHEMVSPIGVLPGAPPAIAAPTGIAEGCYTGQMEFCA